MSQSEHRSVLLKEVLKALISQPSLTPAVYLDCTFGRGGHSRALLEAHPHCQVVALDCDPQAEHTAHSLWQDYPKRFQFYDCNFADLDELPLQDYHGVLFDLGVSSPMLDDPQRGFSFRFSAEPDMRLDPRKGTPASLFLEKATRQTLIQAVRNYGQERYWRRVVRAIINERGTGVLQDTVRLAGLIAKVIPTRPGPAPHLHPATKTFQGIRIAINSELDALEKALSKAMTRLVPKGVLAVISFHSLEDRCTKRFFRRMAGLPEHQADSLPQDLRQRSASILTAKPITPTEAELKANPRSRSAKLRALRRDDSSCIA